MRKNYLWHTIYFLYLFSFLQRSKICENLAESQAAPSQRTWTFQVTQDTSTIRKVSSTQSISGGVLPWEVPTQKTAGNPYSCCWGKWMVGRGPALMKCFLLILNVDKLQFYLNMIAHRERWEKLLWPKDKCTVKSMTKVRRNLKDCAPIFSMYHLTAEDLIKLSQLCHDYLTAVTLFFVTLCSLTANTVLETASVKNLDIRFFFAWPHPSLLAYHWSHNTLIPVSWEWSCFFVLVHDKERCSARELQFVVLLWYENLYSTLAKIQYCSHSTKSLQLCYMSTM